MTNEEIIKNGRNAYSNYMYFECAESGYDAERSRKWETEYFKYIDMAIEAKIDPELLQGLYSDRV